MQSLGGETRKCKQRIPLRTARIQPCLLEQVQHILALSVAKLLGFQRARTHTHKNDTHISTKEGANAWSTFRTFYFQRGALVE